MPHAFRPHAFRPNSDILIQCQPVEERTQITSSNDYINIMALKPDASLLVTTGVTDHRTIEFSEESFRSVLSQIEAELLCSDTYSHALASLQTMLGEAASAAEILIRAVSREAVKLAFQRLPKQNKTELQCSKESFAAGIPAAVAVTELQPPLPAAVFDRKSATLESPPEIKSDTDSLTTYRDRDTDTSEKSKQPPTDETVGTPALRPLATPLAVVAPGSSFGYTVTEPSHTVTEPSHRVTEPSHRVTEPSHRVAEPSHRVAEPSHRVAEPSHRVAEPSHRVTEPSHRVAEPSHRVAEPSHRVAEPSHRVAEPSRSAKRQKNTPEETAAPSVQQRKDCLCELGRELRQGRQIRCLSLQQLHDQTLVPLHHLESIENGEIEKLPQDIYLRGFIRRIGDALGLDGHAMADALPKPEPSQIVNPYLSVSDSSSTDGFQMHPVHLYLGYTALMAGAVGGLAWLSQQPVVPGAQAVPQTQVKPPSVAPAQKRQETAPKPGLKKSISHGGMVMGADMAPPEEIFG
ncbi:MAG: helix-turn-helix domain-containing protein [Microcoleus sp.]